MTEDEIYQNELKNYIPHFMEELDGLLIINQTDDFEIKAKYFTYYISKNVSNNIVLTKITTKGARKFWYNLDSKKISYEVSDINLANEFYSLFIQKMHSNILTQIYNALTVINKNEMTFSPKKLNKFSYIWTIKKHRDQILSIQKEDINNNEEYNLIIKKIDKIPNWFIISKDEDFSVNSVKRLLSFFKVDQRKNDLLYAILGTPIKFNPYETLGFSTPDEDFILDFLKVYENKKEYNPYDIRVKISNKLCPKCKKRLIVKSGRYGEFLGCQNYPECRYTESINNT